MDKDHNTRLRDQRTEPEERPVTDHPFQPGEIAAYFCAVCGRTDDEHLSVDGDHT